MGAHISMLIFIVLGTYPVYWALTVCKNWSRCGQCARARACMLRCLCAYIPYSAHHSGCDRVWHRKLRRKVDSGQFNRWRSEETSEELVEYRYMAWALAISNCRKYTWAITREWALSIHPTKMTTWALTMWWALARDTTVYIYHTCICMYACLHVV